MGCESKRAWVLPDGAGGAVEAVPFDDVVVALDAACAAATAGACVEGAAG